MRYLPFITGSSSKLLSKIATQLRRGHNYQDIPFSPKEILVVEGVISDQGCR